MYYSQVFALIQASHIVLEIIDVIKVYITLPSFYEIISALGATSLRFNKSLYQHSYPWQLPTLLEVTVDQTTSITSGERNYDPPAATESTILIKVK